MAVSADGLYAPHWNEGILRQSGPALERHRVRRASSGFSVAAGRQRGTERDNARVSSSLVVGVPRFG